MFLNLDKLNKNKIAAWAVHGFTGSGAVLGFLAIIAIILSFSLNESSIFF